MMGEERISRGEVAQVVNALIKHFHEPNEYTYEYVFKGALAIAISIIDMEWPPETDDEEILDSSCYQLFAYTLGLGSTLCTEKEDEAKVQKLWDTAGAVATQVYGKSRATTAQVNAWDEYRGAVDKVRKERNADRNLQ